MSDSNVADLKTTNVSDFSDASSPSCFTIVDNFNCTLHCSDSSGSSGWALFSMFYIMLIIVILIGNILVIAAFFKDAALRAITNYWIVSLSMTDVILACTVLPLQTIREGKNGRWLFGPIVCDLFIVLDVLCCTCSIYHLALISLDRYFCVRFPIRYKAERTVRRTLLAIGCTWCWCMIISLPRLLGWKTRGCPEDCTIHNESYLIFSSLVSFYIPLAFIIFMYIGVYKITRRRTRRWDHQLAHSIRMREYFINSAQPIPIEDRVNLPLPGSFAGGLSTVGSSSTRSSGEHTLENKTVGTKVQFDEEDSIVKLADKDYGNICPRAHFADNAQTSKEKENQSVQNSCQGKNTEEGGAKMGEENCEKLGVISRKATPFENRLNLLSMFRSSTTSLSSSLRNAMSSGSNSADQLNQSAINQSSKQSVNDRKRSKDDTDHMMHHQTDLSAQDGAADTRRRIRTQSRNSTTISQRNSSQFLQVPVAREQAQAQSLAHIRKHLQKRAAGPLPRAPSRSASSSKLRKRKQKQEYKATRVVLIVMGAFVLFWAPFFIINLLSPICGPSCHITDNMFKWFTWMGYVNSAVNPFIYTFFNRTFRNAIISVIKCKRIRRSGIALH